MQFLLLFLELLFLALGVYVYMYAIGKLKVDDPGKQKEIDDYRKENGWWMRILSIMLMAFMGMEVFFNIRSFF